MTTYDPYGRSQLWGNDRQLREILNQKQEEALENYYKKQQNNKAKDNKKDYIDAEYYEIEKPVTLLEDKTDEHRNPHIR